MVALEQILLAYAAAWNEAEEGRRRRLLETSWAEKGTYSDPTVQLEGRDALIQHLGQLIKRYPDHRILLTSGIDEHHGMLRFTWTRIGPDGRTIRSGIDFAELADDGRLLRIIGFFDPPVSIPSSWPLELVSLSE